MSISDLVTIVTVAISAWAAWKSTKADKQTRSTGNGFAAYVKDSLRDIRESQGRLEERFDRHVDTESRDK